MPSYDHQVATLLCVK